MVNQAALTAYNSCMQDQLQFGGDTSYCLIAAKSYDPNFVPPSTSSAVTNNTTAPNSTKRGMSTWTILLMLLIIAAIVYFFFFRK